MLPTRSRLTGRTASFVAKRGRSIGGAILRIKWAPARGPLSRATVVAGLTVSKSAVVRNRLKRQCREALRPLLARISPPINLMVFITKAAIGKSFFELKSELEQLLKKARLI
ncbi:MAG: Ribonuclease P protein component [Parcubacteria group bacterium GW2011_GWC2_45_7]|nr:MAG: Ribonuclease P protein component [Parcubacteria group bacterium GW2011_GWC2_45_7]KKU73288.1 MAG: Ribonuclease P protein component [Parcubacteria group bacterium GW2011_GWA2_47_26]